MTKKVYCGVGKVPKKAKRGSAVQCGQQKQIRYWGVMKVDPRLLNSLKTGKTSKVDRMKLIIEVSKLRGRVKKLTTDLPYAKTKKEKDEIADKLAKAKVELKNAIKDFSEHENQRGVSRQSRSKSRSRRRRRLSRNSRKRRSRKFSRSLSRNSRKRRSRRLSRNSRKRRSRKSSKSLSRNSRKKRSRRLSRSSRKRRSRRSR